MNPKALVISVALNIVLVGVVVDQAVKLKHFETYHRQMKTWSKITIDIIKTHYEHGGSFDIPDSLAQKLDAYLIFRANDLD